jgi:antitoxin HigA-1
MKKEQISPTKKTAEVQQSNAAAPHPGIVLLEKHMKPNGLKPQSLSYELRVPATRILAIVQGERSISPDTALRLARFFCTTPEYWLDLQSAYDLAIARNEAGEAITKDVKDGCEKSSRVTGPSRK